MCGFTGIFSQGRIPEKLVYALKESQSNTIYRGPDQQSLIRLKEFALSFNRLSINNLEEGKQPLMFKAKIGEENSVACFNGEIFNYKDLETEYLCPPHNRDEIGVIVDLYKLFGTDFFKLLNGQFAIFLYLPESKKIILARDPFGIRPLFFSNFIDNSFIFASDLNSLWEFGIPKEISILQLGRIHASWATNPSRTVWQNINQVNPGSYIEIDLEISKSFKCKTSFFWNWSEFINNSNKNSYSLRQDDLERFRFEFKEAVRRQSMSDVGVGCYVSGGIDSSVTAYELQNLQKRIRTYSIEFKDAQYDESANQVLITNQIQSQHRKIVIKDNDISQNFLDVTKFIQQPFFRTAPVPLYLLSRLVRNDNQKVIMTGEGADEMLFGYDIFREQSCIDFIKKRPDSKWRYHVIDQLYAYLPQFNNPRYRKLAIDTLMREGDYSILNPLKSRLSNNLRSLAVSDAIDSKLIVQELIEEYVADKSFESLDNLDKIQKFEIDNLLAGYLLSSQGDRVSMANSVEGRYPYLDLDFVKYLSTIPREWKLKGNFFKRILRTSYKDLIPSKIINSPKIAYQAPEARAILSNQQILDSLQNKNNPIFQFYSFSKLKKIISRIQGSNISSRGSFTDNLVICLCASMSSLLND
jgi:asparagine synthase (glutamine-hydrolysing)